MQVGSGRRRTICLLSVVLLICACWLHRASESRWIVGAFTAGAVLYLTGSIGFWVRSRRRS